nr:hypothetical protein CFP56_10111 [Quercus suber]
MPSLSQIHCSVKLKNGAPLTEYATRYKDGIVETYVAVPGAQSFYVHVTSKGYIAEGLAVFIFIDGKYQANRNKVDLKFPTHGDAPTSSYEIDLRFRQKEEKSGPGSFVGRSWSFAAAGSTENGPRCSEDEAKDIGNIEIVVLRCRAGDPASRSVLSRSALPSKPSTKSGRTHRTKGKKSKAEGESPGGLFGDGLLGLFDGAADGPAVEMQFRKVAECDACRDHPIPPGIEPRVAPYPTSPSYQVRDASIHPPILDGTDERQMWDCSKPATSLRFQLSGQTVNTQVEYSIPDTESAGVGGQHDPFWGPAPQEDYDNLESDPRHGARTLDFGNMDQSFAPDARGVNFPQATFFGQPPVSSKQAQDMTNFSTEPFAWDTSRWHSTMQMPGDQAGYRVVADHGVDADYFPMPDINNDTGYPLMPNIGRDADFHPTPAIGHRERPFPQDAVTHPQFTLDGPGSATYRYDPDTPQRKDGKRVIGTDAPNHQPPTPMQFGYFIPQYGTNIPNNRAAYQMYRGFPPPPNHPAPCQPLPAIPNNRRASVNVPMQQYQPGQDHQQQARPPRNNDWAHPQMIDPINLGRNAFDHAHAHSQLSQPENTIDLGPQKTDKPSEQKMRSQKPKYNLARVAKDLESYLATIQSHAKQYRNIISKPLPGIDVGSLTDRMKDAELIITLVAPIYKRLKEVQGSGVTSAALMLPGGLPAPIYQMLDMKVPSDAHVSPDNVDRASGPTKPSSRTESVKANDAWDAQSSKTSNASGVDWGAAPNGKHNVDTLSEHSINTDGDTGVSQDNWNDKPSGQDANDTWPQADAVDGWADSTDNKGKDQAADWDNQEKNDNSVGTWDQGNNETEKETSWGAKSNHSKKSNASDTGTAHSGKTGGKTGIPSYFADWRQEDSTSRPSPRPLRNPYIYPAEPLPSIPPSMQKTKTHVVRMEEGAPFEVPGRQPEYLDSMSHPFAVFRFKYRSANALKKTLKMDIVEDVDNEKMDYGFASITPAELMKQIKKGHRIMAEETAARALDAQNEMAGIPMSEARRKQLELHGNTPASDDMMVSGHANARSKYGAWIPTGAGKIG